MKLFNLLKTFFICGSVSLIAASSFAETEQDAAKAECKKAMGVYSKEFSAQREKTGQKPANLDMASECAGNVHSLNFWRCVTDKQRDGNDTIFSMNNCTKAE